MSVSETWGYGKMSTDLVVGGFALGGFAVELTELVILIELTYEILLRLLSRRYTARPSSLKASTTRTHTSM